MYIPLGLEPEDHIKCSDARTFGRFPTLTYFNRQLGYSIWRSSSQSFDTSTKRSIEDDKYLASLNKNSEQKYYIFNPAEKSATKTSLENESYYPGSKTVIYKMSQNRDVSAAFESMWEACQTFTESKAKFIKLTEKSRWFKIINRVLKKAILI